MKTESIRARALQPGHRIRLADGSWVRLTEAKQTRAFRVSLSGHPDRYAIMAEWGRDYTLLHPEEMVEVRA